MRLRPTRRLPGMCAAAGAVYLFATNSQVIWLYLIAALLLGLVVVGLVAPLLAVRGLRPRLSGWRRSGFVAPLPQDRGRVFAGDRVTLILELGRESPPVDFGPVLTSTGRLPVGSRVEGSTAQLELDAGRRGLRVLATVRVSSGWPLGIATAERWFPLNHRLLVHPRYALPAGQRREGTREPAGQAARRGPGDEFLGLREYRSGDSMRRIHWPTSARTGALMVVETAEESSIAGAYELVLAADASMAAAELAVELAASLGSANVAAGLPLTMAVPGQGRPLHRWGEAMDALAETSTGLSTPPGRWRDAMQVRASGRQVMCMRGDALQVLEEGVNLAGALDALTGIR